MSTDPLDDVSIRVLGALMEKERTTPDNYPLTLNALTAACNQTSNRDPVLHLSESTVLEAVKGLTARGFVRALHRSDSRVLRYRQTITEALHLHAAEAAILCVLFLRGPQTPGELRTRTARMHEFPDLDHVEVTLRSLMTLSEPLVAEMPRRSGQKEVRFVHLLSAPPQARTARTHVVLVHPEIHWNTGNAARTCLAVDATLHLIEPLGFSLDEKEIRRAGLDYWEHVDVRVWPDWQSFEAGMPSLGEPLFFSSEGGRFFWESPVSATRDMVLVFGREADGLPAEIREKYHARLVSIPMLSPHIRSLNLSTAVALAAYEVMRRRRG